MRDEGEEKQRLDALRRAQELREATALRPSASFERSAPVQRLRASRLLSAKSLMRSAAEVPLSYVEGHPERAQSNLALVACIGFALFVSGIERAPEELPFVSNPHDSIALGPALVATGLLLRKPAGSE